MRRLATLAVLFVSAAAFGQMAKPCEELKAEIAKKMDAKGVKGYSLEVVAKDKEADGKVVGTCQGGTKKIVYRNPASAAQTPVPEEKKQ